MTPLPKPQPRAALVRARYPIQLTTWQRAMRNRPRQAMNPTQEQIAAALPQPPKDGDTIAALPARVLPESEMDAGFYAALLKRQAVVGLGQGEVPRAVAERLWDAGLVRVVAKPAGL